MIGLLYNIKSTMYENKSMAVEKIQKVLTGNEMELKNNIYDLYSIPFLLYVRSDFKCQLLIMQFKGTALVTLSVYIMLQYLHISIGIAYIHSQMFILGSFFSAYQIILIKAKRY